MPPDETLWLPYIFEIASFQRVKCIVNICMWIKAIRLISYVIVSQLLRWLILQAEDSDRPETCQNQKTEMNSHSGHFNFNQLSI